ncbi:MAG TPA: ligase-associated DNA damage response endonuclease PdeM [Hyphomicrobiaceae bacterium]|nr:ligase-associated DNA damage response endonuclease PdeM [Hyphomicrobiaceae bacterium]
MLGLKPERFNMTDYATQPISVCGKAFVGDQSGALYWPGERTLIVADLHLEKGSAFAARGTQMLPPYDTRETLLKLARAIDKFDAQTVIALGDSFHDPDGSERMSSENLAILRIMQEDRRWLWITGNHDPEIAERAGGEVQTEIEIEGLRFRHEPFPGPVTHEIAGHLHPAARLSLHGYTLRRACFIGNGRRLVLPAYGALTGGLNILDSAFEPVFGHERFSVWMLGDEGLYPVATRSLKPD